MNINFPSTAEMNNMERYLDLAARKQSLAVSNLANIDTPGHRTLDFSIELEMRAAAFGQPGMLLRTHSPQHRRGLAPSALAPGEAVDGLPQRNDGNNVDLDREMLNLTRTTTKFSILTQILRAEFRKLQQAMSEGR